MSRLDARRKNGRVCLGVLDLLGERFDCTGDLLWRIFFPLLPKLLESLVRILTGDGDMVRCFERKAFGFSRGMAEMRHQGKTNQSVCGIGVNVVGQSAFDLLSEDFEDAGRKFFSARDPQVTSLVFLAFGELYKCPELMFSTKLKSLFNGLFSSTVDVCDGEGGPLLLSVKGNGREAPKRVLAESLRPFKLLYASGLVIKRAMDVFHAQRSFLDRILRFTGGRVHHSVTVLRNHEALEEPLSVLGWA